MDYETPLVVSSDINGYEHTIARRSSCTWNRLRNRRSLPARATLLRCLFTKRPLFLPGLRRLSRTVRGKEKERPPLINYRKVFRSVVLGESSKTVLKDIHRWVLWLFVLLGVGPSCCVLAEFCEKQDQNWARQSQELESSRCLQMYVATETPEAVWEYLRGYTLCPPQDGNLAGWTGRGMGQYQSTPCTNLRHLQQSLNMRNAAIQFHEGTRKIQA
ncbi:Protein of unknown function [Pyronema omphalodes CBS 100304]|uniref:Uncharacterized protein n=1 Tax=Pyronema omphalodes (strain CBS 100304) TaxID=1076935 RepID=U4LJU8_PYROM|nr:Protein of unknown function [Pyronema omphalodes CBS 100304]